MPLDRKTPPLAAAASFDAAMARAWAASTGRPQDSFVGILQISTTRFHMYPAFLLNDVDPTVCCGGMDAAADEPRAGVVAQYGADALFVHALGGVVDGAFHRGACQKAAVPEVDALGWALFGNCNPGVDCQIRFVSGRNLGKFTPRAPRAGETPVAAEARWAAANKDSRDMPRAWAQWLVDAVRQHLHLPYGGYATMATSAGSHSKVYLLTMT